MRLTTTIGFAVMALAAFGFSHPSAQASTTPSTRVNPKDGAAMVYVPAGEFTMGSDTGGNSEKPQRKVYLDGYWMYKNLVTVEQYQKFCRATGHAMPDPPTWGWKKDHPIVNVSWDDVNAYCAWAHAALPTEAQWEKAARGTDGREYPWGSTFDSSKLQTTVGAKNPPSTAAVGSFPKGASPYGCLDMVGEVGQWCADWYNGDYYKSAPRRNPTGPPAGAGRVLRGGSWGNDSPVNFRCTIRNDSFPTNRYGLYGFRCVVAAGLN